MIHRHTAVFLLSVAACSALSQDATAGLILSDPEGLKAHTDVRAVLSDSVVGFQFTALTDLTVTALGWTDTEDGIQLETHTIGLWSLDGTLLASVDVSPTSTLTSTLTRTESISPISLSAGQSYVLGGTLKALHPGGSDLTGYFTNAGGDPEPLYFEDIWDPRIVIDGGRSTGSSSLAFPTDLDPETLFGPNAVIADGSAVPEPTSMSLLAMGVLSAAGMARIRKRSPTPHM